MIFLYSCILVLTFKTILTEEIFLGDFFEEEKTCTIDFRWVKDIFKWAKIG